MEPNSFILPQIMSSLTGRPHRWEYLDNIYTELNDAILQKYPDAKPSQIRRAIRKALEVGQSLGIITMANEMVRTPFKISSQEKRAPGLMQYENELNDNMEEALYESTVNRIVSNNNSIKQKKRRTTSTPKKDEPKNLFKKTKKNGKGRITKRRS